MRSPYLHISTIFECTERFLVVTGRIRRKCSPFVHTEGRGPDGREERIGVRIASLSDKYSRMSGAHAK